MSPRQNVEGLIISVFVFFVSTHGYALTDNDVPRVYQVYGGDMMIPQNGLMMPHGRNTPLSAAEEEALEVRFPKLSIKQRKFAVNPGYMSYYNPDFEVIEDERDMIEQSLRKEKEVAEEIIKEENDIEKVIESERQSLEPVDDDMDETVETADEYALEPADSKKASAVSMSASERLGVELKKFEEARVNDIYFTTIVAVSSAVAVFAIVGAGVCYHRLQKNAKATEDVEYPAYGVTGPGKEISPTSGGDRKLAQNAQMYHYQHQKQQMIAFDSHQNNANRGGALVSDDESDEGEEGDYTVYECPGLATTGEMEVRNPLFSEDQTPKASSMPPNQSSQ